jgi:pimeloyl-ACP methyl ester carboxylesterase
MGGLARRLLGILIVLTAVAMALLRTPDVPAQALVARWAMPPSDFIDLKGQTVHLRDVGPRSDPVPIVLVHGTSASLHTWEGWVAAMQGQRRVISFDLPAFGLTGPFAGAYAGQPYTGEAYARFVLDLLDQLGVARFAIAGNSLGGEVAWRTALAAPQRVHSLVLVDAAGLPFTPESVPVGFRIARTPGLRRLTEFALPRELVAASVRNVYGDPSRVSEELIDRYYHLTLREGNRRALVERFDVALATPDASQRVAGLRLPTLILWGGRDALIPPAIGREFQRLIPGSELQVFEDLGHVPHEEDAARTVATAKAFWMRP